MDDYDETPVLIIFLGEYSRLFLVVWEMQHMRTVSGTSVCPVRNLHTYADLLRVMSVCGTIPGVPVLIRGLPQECRACLRIRTSCLVSHTPNTEIKIHIFTFFSCLSETDVLAATGCTAGYHSKFGGTSSYVTCLYTYEYSCFSSVSSYARVCFRTHKIVEV